MDVHRSFAQLAIVEDGLCRGEGRIGVKPEDLRAWALTLSPDDEIVLEATTNSDAIAVMLRPIVARVVVSNPRKTRAIAEAKVKTDKVDARILAQLLAADFMPETWVADDRTRMRRRLVARRTHLVRQRTRLKNQVHAVLARNLVATCPHADLFGGVGRRWLGAQSVPADERRSIDALRAIPFVTVAPICCGRGRTAGRGGLPEDVGRVQRLVRRRRGVRGIPGAVTLGRRVLVPGVRVDEVLASQAGAGLPVVRRVRQASVGDLRDGVRGDSDAADPVVRGGLACVRDQERRVGPRPPEAARLGQLRDGVDVAAQAASGDGRAGP